MHPLPSVLAPAPAIPDQITSSEDLQAILSGSSVAGGKVTNPEQTPIVICTVSNCNRLFPNRERLSVHRKRDHPSLTEEDVVECITWNEK